MPRPVVCCFKQLVASRSCRSFNVMHFLQPERTEVVSLVFKLRIDEISPTRKVFQPAADLPIQPFTLHFLHAPSTFSQKGRSFYVFFTLGLFQDTQYFTQLISTFESLFLDFLWCIYMCGCLLNFWSFSF
jgi:hypothetical protein